MPVAMTLDVGRMNVPLSNAILLRWFILFSNEADFAEVTGIPNLNDTEGEMTLWQLLLLRVTQFLVKHGLRGSVLAASCMIFISRLE